MCELFAINSGRPVLANAYLREFYTHSHDNPHGWGLSWRDDHGKPGDPEADVMLWREPIPAYESTLLPKILSSPWRPADWRRTYASPPAAHRAWRTATRF